MARLRLLAEAAAPTKGDGFGGETGAPEPTEPLALGNGADAEDAGLVAFDAPDVGTLVMIGAAKEEEAVM